MATAGSLIADILLQVLGGSSLKSVILEKIDSQINPFMGHPFLKWMNYKIKVSNSNKSSYYFDEFYPSSNFTSSGEIVVFTSSSDEFNPVVGESYDVQIFDLTKSVPAWEKEIIVTG